MKKIESVLRSSMAHNVQLCSSMSLGENVQYLALLNTEPLSTKWTLETLLIFHSCKNQEKTVLSVFVSTCNFEFRSHLYLYQNSFAVSSVRKIRLFQFLRLLHFQKSYMNAELRFQVGPGAPNFSGAPGPMWS